MEATQAPNRTGIYCRLSYTPDGSVEKVERQEQDCRVLGERLRWPETDPRHVYVDNSRSAWQRTRKRPSWDRMLADVEAGEIDGLLVYHGDRLMRQPHDLERLLGVADTRSVRIASPSGTRDLDNPDDRFILRIEVAAACRESDSTSRRLRRQLAANREAGRTQRGGHRPFGYGVQIGTKERVDRATGEVVMVPVYDTDQQVPAEARYLREAVERLLAGQSQRGIIAWLRTEGVRTTKGGEMTPRALRHLLRAPRIAGLIEVRGERHTAAWDGIITPETWEEVQAYYRRSAEQHRYPGRARRHLLSGIATCYRCGNPVVAKPKGGRNHRDVRLYACHQQGCRAVGRNLAHLDAWVEGRTVRLLQDPGLVAQLVVADDRPDVAAEITALERRRADTQAQLDALVDHPDVDVTAALRGLSSYDRRLHALRQEVVSSTEHRALLRMTGITREQWDATPIDVRAATVHALWEITILPATRRGPGFDPASVRMVRRTLSPTDDGGHHGQAGV